ncbi:MAG: aminopeptidase P family protein [Actinomycetota bacterium]
MSVGELPPLLVSGRLDRLRERLAQLPVEALVLHRLVDVRWLTGFTGTAGLAVVTPDDALLVTDPRYGERAEGELGSSAAEVRIEVAAHERQRELVDAALVGHRVGVDATALTWEQARELSAGPAASVEPVGAVVAGLRTIKDAAEIARMRAAAAVADEALATVRPSLADRPTEAEVARALDRAMEDRGADGPGYGTIVASGPNAALPHAAPGDRVIGEGDTVIIDVGAEVDGYRSDMTRSFVIGEPDADQELWLDAVQQAQEAAVDRVRPGATGVEVHEVAVAALAEHGLREAFVHGVGHGVGLVIHEDPFLARSDEPLRPGQVVTVEPGVYLPGRGGVRWEDLLLVTDDEPEALTSSPKDPIVR